MSDEDSFVILGTSPLPSLNNNLRAVSQIGNGAPDNRNKEAPSSTDIKMADSETFLQNASANGFVSSERPENRELSCNINSSGSSASTVIGETSLAASFILGEVDADVLKTSVISQFPSISMESSAEDVVKLQNLMTEYIDLKSSLSKVNMTLRRFYNNTQQWKDDMRRMEQQYKTELLDCQKQMAALRNENMELKRDVESKIDVMNVCDDVRQREFKELLQSISEKSAQIDNMRVQIEKLEQHQLASFEYVPKNENDSKTSPDYVDRLEHQRVVNQFNHQMSELLAENLELKDLQKQYMDEINCLKVNVTAFEELTKKLHFDINLLKAKDMEKSSVFTKYEIDRDHMKEDLLLLRQQVEVYSKDFEMERTARQNIAGEKEQLLQDLRALQRKNQELIEDAQKQMGSAAAATSASATLATVAAEASEYKYEQNVTSTSSTCEKNQIQQPIKVTSNMRADISLPSSIHRCPICYKYYESLTVLQSHVNYCLDKN